MNRSVSTYLVAAAVVVIIIISALVAATRKPSPAATAMSPMPSATAPAATSPSASPTEATAVTIQNYAFAPASITVKVGTTVTWTNQDPVSHTVTFDTADNKSSDLFGRGKTYTYTFTKVGTYTYHCTPHPYMKGTVVVTSL